MYLAQLNIAKLKYSLDAPQMRDFVDNLEPINAIAEASPGFVWRLKDESGDATDITVDGLPDMIVNMSVWENVAALKEFMFKTHHIHIMKRKQEWFEPLDEAAYVLWWIPVGHQPTVVEALAKLYHLRINGDTPEAFSFKQDFPAPK